MEINQTITINRHSYQLIEPINTGHAGFSDIWKAKNIQGQTVVLKTVKQDQFSESTEHIKQEYLKHLNREIDFLKSLTHAPCHFIITLLDHGKLNGLPVLVLPYIDYNLSDFIQQSRQINLTHYLDWCIQISKALLTIHTANFHYRDLKLTNILTDDKGMALKLADFGTVKINAKNELHTYNGTPSRMAPEQMLPSSRKLNKDSEYDYFYDTDHRTDFFSLGLIFFELITGIKQLASQHDIQNLRERQGAQAAWEQRNDLGGINQREIAVFKNKLTNLFRGDSEATLFTLGQDLDQPSCVQPLTDLISSLLARDKNDRPEQAESIITALSNIVMPLASNRPIYAFTANEESADTVIAKTESSHKISYYMASAFVVITISSTFAYPLIKQHFNQAPLEHVIELPLDDTEIPLAKKIHLPTLLNNSNIEKQPKEKKQAILTAELENKTQFQQNLIKQNTVNTTAKIPAVKIITSLEKDLKTKTLSHKVIEKTTDLKTAKQDEVLAVSTDKVYQPLPPAPIKKNNQTINLTENNNIIATAKTLVPIFSAKTDNTDQTKLKLIELNVLDKKTNVEARQPSTFDLLNQSDSTKLPNGFPFQNMLVIAADQFSMGNKNGFVDEKPERLVNIQSFAVSKQLITEQQFMEFCIQTQHLCAKSNKSSLRPITDINKQQVLNYINHLSKKSHYTLRLLSEAEWEYLALNKKQVEFNGLEWIADCAHFNYRQAPNDGSAWLGQHKGNCQISIVRGNKLKQPLNKKTARNRFPIPITMKKNNLGFRVAVSL